MPEPASSGATPWVVGAGAGLVLLGLGLACAVGGLPTWPWSPSGARCPWWHADAVEVSGPGSRERFAWSDLTGVARGPLRLLGHAGTSVPLPERELASDPALVARLLGHYAERPRDRRELGDGRAAERERDDGFVHGESPPGR